MSSESDRNNVFAPAIFMGVGTLGLLVSAGVEHAADLDNAAEISLTAAAVAGLGTLCAAAAGLYYSNKSQ